MNGNGQLSLKEVTRIFNTEKYDLNRVHVFVMLLPSEKVYPITGVTLVGSDKDKAVYLIAGEEEKSL